jgi:hypothetical protein
METGTTRLAERAKDIFTELGYTVSESGSGLRAERKWRVVQVTALADEADLPDSDAGEMRCFIALERQAAALREAVLDLAPEYDWAIISVGDGSNYEVLHPPRTTG